MCTSLGFIRLTTKHDDDDDDDDDDEVVFGGKLFVRIFHNAKASVQGTGTAER